MSNLAYVKLQPSNNYQDLSTLSGVTFVSGTTYLFQVKGTVIFCEQSTEPTEEGFTWNNIEPFEYIAKGETIWVKAVAPFNGTDTAIINIAD